MRHSRALNLTFVLGVILAGTAPAPAGAVPMSFDLVGVTDPTLTAHVVFAYNATSNTAATVDIDITNTSVVPHLGDPRFTAFAYNVPTAVTGVSNFTGPSGWRESFSRDNINTPGQYGMFDIAGLTGPNFGGGDANDGLQVLPPPAGIVSFSFELTGTGLDGLDEMSFLGLLSSDAPGRPDPQYFIGRFQRTGPGPNPGGSDVAIPSDPPVPVPEPVSLVLFGSGLTGLWWTRRRKS